MYVLYSIVEPLNNGHIGTCHFVLYREVPSLQRLNVLYNREETVHYRKKLYCVFYSECPLSEEQFYLIILEAVFSFPLCSRL